TAPCTFCRTVVGCIAHVDRFLIAICFDGGGVGKDDGAYEDIGMAVDAFCDGMNGEDGGDGHSEG
ncbi:hypothetical protein M422DRAFT_37473, partial [Sphaerobolus stellatus SS14]